MNPSETSSIQRFQQLYSSQLGNLSQVLKVAEQHFADDLTGLFAKRLAPDMFPFGTQIAFCCNQPYHFARWCLGQEIVNLEPEVLTLELAHQHIANTQALLSQVQADDSKLAEIKRVQLGPEMYLELPGIDYVHQFLMPNFYFHLTTAYAILRNSGAPLGKADYMHHLGPLVKFAQV